MTSRARMLLTLGLLVAAGCAKAAPAEEPTTPIAGEVAPRRGRARRNLHMAKPTFAARPSEHEAVVDDAPDPEAQRMFTKRLAEPAVPLGAAAPRVTEMALADTARGEAPDMTPLGDVVGASLKEGQRAMMPVTLAPGECATFIAEGGLGVIEVDLFLLLADRSAGVRVLAEDPDKGPIGVVGGSGRCYENKRPAPLDAELHVMVQRGAGVVLLRGYKKQKMTQLAEGSRR